MLSLAWDKAKNKFFFKYPPLPRTLTKTASSGSIKQPLEEEVRRKHTMPRLISDFPVPASLQPEVLCPCPWGWRGEVRSREHHPSAVTPRAVCLPPTPMGFFFFFASLATEASEVWLQPDTSSITGCLPDFHCQGERLYYDYLLFIYFCRGIKGKNRWNMNHSDLCMVDS